MQEPSSHDRNTVPSTHSVMPIAVIADDATLPPMNENSPPDIPTTPGAEAEDSDSSPLHFTPAEPFESEDEAEVPSSTMAVSQPHPTDRGTVAAITSARKKNILAERRIPIWCQGSQVDLLRRSKQLVQGRGCLWRGRL